MQNLAQSTKNPKSTDVQSSSAASSKDEEEEEEEEVEFSDNGGDMEDFEAPWEGGLRWIYSPKFEVGLGGGGEIVKDCNSIPENKISRCNHFGNKWSGWNNTKALGHEFGGGGHQGLCKGWRKLYLGIFNCTS